MALIAINAGAAGLTGLGALPRALDAVAPGGAVTLMTHGFRFDPDTPDRDPHTHILSMVPRPCWKAVSWPRHLHLHRRDDHLGIAFGWPALGGLPAVAARAFDAGAAMARLMQEIARRRPDLRINVIAHSLGARVALTALAAVAPGTVHRMILMSGAEYLTTARAALAHGRGDLGAHTGVAGTRVLNVASGENTVFDGLFRLCVAAPDRDDRTLGSGLRAAGGWTDFRVDDPVQRRIVRGMGVRLPAPATRMCHWSTYLRPGLFSVYRRVLDPERAGFLPQLDAALSQAEAGGDAARWPLNWTTSWTTSWTTGAPSVRP